MKEKTTGNYVGAIIGNIVALAFLNTVLLWRQYTRGVILASWAQIVGNFLLCFFRPCYFSALMRAAFAAVGLLSLIVFYIVFPLDFTELVGTWLNTLIKVLMMIGIACTATGLIVGLVQFTWKVGQTVAGEA